MKRILLFSISLLWVSFGTWAQEENFTPPLSVDTIPANEAAYAMGVYIGNIITLNIQNSPGGDLLSKEEVLKGIADKLNEKATLSNKQADSIGQAYMHQQYLAMGKRTKSEGEDFLLKNAKKEGVKTTQSGLQYLIVQEGKGPKPTVEDTVIVHYKGQLLDGKEFDNSYKRGEPARFNPMQVIPGWTEGLCLLPEGTKARLFVPYNLAYGEKGMGNVIPPYAVLIFDIELKQVIKGKPIPYAEARPISEEKVITPHQK